MNKNKPWKQQFVQICLSSTQQDTVCEKTSRENSSLMCGGTGKAALIKAQTKTNARFNRLSCEGGETHRDERLSRLQQTEI